MENIIVQGVYSTLSLKEQNEQMYCTSMVLKSIQGLPPPSYLPVLEGAYYIHTVFLPLIAEFSNTYCFLSEADQDGHVNDKGIN